MTNTETCRCDTVHTAGCSFGGSADTAAIEALRAFADVYHSGAFTRLTASGRLWYGDVGANDRDHFAAFIHMCTAALQGESWAMERVQDCLARISNTDHPVVAGDKLYEIQNTDTTRPDGAIARGLVTP